MSHVRDSPFTFPKTARNVGTHHYLARDALCPIYGYGGREISAVVLFWMGHSWRKIDPL